MVNGWAVDMVIDVIELWVRIGSLGTSNQEITEELASPLLNLTVGGLLSTHIVISDVPVVMSGPM